MAFFLMWWRTETGRRKVGKGTFDCPACESAQRFVRYRLEQQQRVNSVLPVGAAESLGEFLKCKRCLHEFDHSLFVPRSGDGHMVAAAWECPKCKARNPNRSYKCLKCHYSLV